MNRRERGGRAAAPLSPRAALRWPLILRGLRQARPTRVLEIGCGLGAMGMRIATRVPHYEAIEPDPRSQAVAQTRLGSVGAHVRLASTADLAGDGSFDLACAFEVLEHIQDDRQALREWAGWLRPGGFLLLSVPAWQHQYGPWDRAVGHYRRYSPAELADALVAGGFEPVWTRVYGWPLANALEAVRNRLARRSGQEGAGKEEGTARSGRWLQPSGRVAAAGVTIGTAPFRVLQRLAPRRGNGIVALARRAG